MTVQPGFRGSGDRRGPHLATEPHGLACREPGKTTETPGGGSKRTVIWGMSAYMKKMIDHADLLVKPGDDIHLVDFDPAFTSNFKNEHDATGKLTEDVEHLSARQDIFHADQRYALLIIFQGMDAAGKDGAIRHVMSGVSPQGVDVYPFKQPSAQELSHDYLWRCAKVLPERGRIAIFNRSYYEELAVVRVHETLFERERLPSEPSGSDLWRDRYQDILSSGTSCATAR